MRDKFRSKFDRPKIEHHRGGLDHTRTARLYYWVWGLVDGQRHFLWGPFTTRQKAQEKGDKANTPYEIKELRTRDEATASSLLRGKGSEED